MTGRERLIAAYTRKPKDRAPWTPIIWTETISRYAPEERAAGPMAFTRNIGADILWRWGDFLKTQTTVERVDKRDGDLVIRQWQTPAGTLREVYRGSRIVEHKLKSRTDILAFRRLIEQTRYAPNPGRYEELLTQVGEDGIVAPHIGPSAVQRLIQMEAGVSGFAYLCADHGGEMEALIEAMHQRDLDRFRIAAQTPAEVLILVENTSTLLLSPAMYRRWSRRHVSDFCRIAHENGKTAMVHMCGHVKGLLNDIAATGLDGIDCLTPPPTGNTTPEDAWAASGPELIVHGILDPTAWIQRTADEIMRAMDRALPAGTREKQFLLCTAADGLPDIPRQTWDILAEAHARFSAR